jgi:hypothetical protein
MGHLYHGYVSHNQRVTVPKPSENRGSLPSTAGHCWLRSWRSPQGFSETLIHLHLCFLLRLNVVHLALQKTKGIRIFGGRILALWMITTEILT